MFALAPAFVHTRAHCSLLTLAAPVQNIESKVFNPNRAGNQQEEYDDEENESDYGSASVASSANPNTHTFLKKKTGTYVKSEGMAKLNLGKRREDVILSPRVEEKRAQAQKGGLPARQGQLKPRR